MVSLNLVVALTPDGKNILTPIPYSFLIPMVESHAKRVAAGKKAAATRRRNEGSGRVRTAASRVKRSYHKRVARPKLIEMVLFALLGYETGPVLDRALGGPLNKLYATNSTFREMKDASGVASSGNFVSKLLGAGVGADAAYKSVKSGKISNKALNMELPFALGAIIDGPSGGSSNSQGGW